MSDKQKFAFDKVNFILLSIGMAIVIIGFLLMTGPTSSETLFEPDIFSRLLRMLITRKHRFAVSHSPSAKYSTGCLLSFSSIYSWRNRRIATLLQFQTPIRLHRLST